MITNKIGATLQLALRYERLLSETFKSLFMTSAEESIWEIIMQYSGSIESIQDQYSFRAYDLQGGFAQIFIPKIEIPNLSNNPQVVFLSLPTRCEYIDIGLGAVCASNISKPGGSFTVTGAGILLAVIDSGIDYSHPDFRSMNGNTRIKYLWDQTLQGTPPIGFSSGVEFTSEQINEALSQDTKEAQLAIVPTQDEIGHGTALAGIAAGNGRGSVGNINKGMAPECELIIVKLGSVTNEHPRDIEVMQGIHYALEKAKALGSAVTLLIGIGNNLTAHDGTAPLELYIDEQYNTWLSNIVVGVGNQGNRGSHTTGQLMEGQSQERQLLIEGEITNYGCCIWKKFSDDMTLVIQAPNGERTDELSLLTANRAYLFDQTAVLINFSEPITNTGSQEIFILFQGQGGANINRGIWTLTLTGSYILEGGFNIWGSIVTEETNLTRFLNSELERTLTTPATARKITSVAAYNSLTLQIAPFSGRGFTADEIVKPDITAPGVNITVPASGGGNLYTTLSGTSVASAFVAGAYVLMMSYGIFQLGNINLYGDVLKIYLLRAARRPNSHAPYPNNSWGYGLLCVETALTNMKEVAEQQS